MVLTDRRSALYMQRITATLCWGEGGYFFAPIVKNRPATAVSKISNWITSAALMGSLLPFRTFFRMPHNKTNKGMG